MNQNPQRKPRTIEELAEESRKIISRMPEPKSNINVWDSKDGHYVQEHRKPTLWDCEYVDNMNQVRVWVLYADSVQEVIQNFNELVGEGRITSIMPAAEWD